MSVKVAVRCRPFNQTEIQEGAESAIRMDKERVEVQFGGHHHTFCYDETLCSVENTPNMATQKTVYEAVAMPLLGHVLQGYNGCIFAYGQTGSGKTYSMVGTETERGLIPRIADNLFRELPALQQTGVETCVEVSFFEIYNERVRCLLRPTAGGFDDSALRVREHPTFGPFVEGLAKFVVTNKEECLKLLDDGTKVRSTASTAMNAVSSRSHAVFTITLTQTKSSDTLVINTTSKLNLVDLAGSERASRTLATGKRLAEGSTINKSLTCLGKVISALAESTDNTKNRHIPYRDSTLTWILKDNLGGNSKTVMLATVSPAAIQLEETLSTLRYAERAKKIMNKAVVNESNNNEVIAALQKEIEALNAALKSATQTDRAALMEEIMATEAMKRELDTTMADKLAETKRMMEEREEYMKRLESRLDSQNAEIEALKAANAEKEQRILQLLQTLQSNTNTAQSSADFEQMRIRVAELEREQNAAQASIDTKTGNKPMPYNMGQYDPDLSLGSSTGLDISLGSLSLVDDDIHLDTESAVDENFDIDLDLDDLMAAATETQNPASSQPLTGAVHHDPNVAVIPSPSSGLAADPEIILDEPADDSIHLSSGSSIILDADEPTPAKAAGPVPVGQRETSDVIDLGEWDDVPPSQGSTMIAAGATNPVVEPTVVKQPSPPPAEVSDSTEKPTASTVVVAEPEIMNPVGTVFVSHINSDELDHNRFLWCIIPAQVTFGTLRYGRCGVECNLFQKTIAILTVHGKVIDQYPSSKLHQVQLNPTVACQLEISFAGVQKHYYLQLNTTQECSALYQLFMLSHRNTIMWSPSLCSHHGASELNLLVHGTTIQRDSACVHVKGDCVLPLANMPYEIYDFWYGCFSLEGKGLPMNPALFNGFLPAQRRDLYIIGSLDVPDALLKNDDIGNFFLHCLGEEEFCLAGTTAGNRSEPTGGVNSAMTVICRKAIYSKISHISFTFFPKDNGPYAGLGASVVINESSLAILLLNDDIGSEFVAKERNFAIRSMVSLLPFGDSTADASVRFDYLIVSGVFNYKHPFIPEKDEIRQHMKTNNILSDFTEMEPSSALKTVTRPSRILTYIQPHVARMQLFEYSTSRALTSSSFIVGDLFCQRHYLNLFTKSLLSLSVQLTNIVFKPKRVPPNIRGVAIHFSGNIVDGYPFVYRLNNEGQLTEKITETIVVPLLIDSLDFVQMQLLRVSFYGVVPSSSSPVLIGSGTIPLKSMLRRLGEPHSYKATMHRSACSVGVLHGHITVIGKPVPRPAQI